MQISLFSTTVELSYSMAFYEVRYVNWLQIYSTILSSKGQLYLPWTEAESV